MEDLKKSVRELEVKLDDNVKLIIENMNKLHSHEDKINANAIKIQENSFALDILRDIKQDNTNLAISNKRFFRLLILVLFMWFVTIGYLVYVLNDTTDYQSVEIEDVETIDNSHIKIGDDIWEKSK